MSLADEFETVDDLLVEIEYDVVEDVDDHEERRPVLVISRRQEGTESGCTLEENVQEAGKEHSETSGDLLLEIEYDIVEDVGNHEESPVHVLSRRQEGTESGDSLRDNVKEGDDNKWSQ